MQKKIEKYREGIIVQTVGKLEDPLDGETMMETEAVHKQNFMNLKNAQRKMARHAPHRGRVLYKM